MSEYQRRYLPSHAVLRSFESAARHQSFTLAAGELHLTQSAISRQVKELENTVGTALFRRVGRGVVLTAAGQNLADGLAVDLENMHRTIMRAVSAGKMGAAIRVATLPAFASRFMIPRLPAFFERYPNIEVSLSTRLEPFDMSEGRFDLAVHFGKADWPGADLRYLCSETLIPVASPAFIDKHGVKGSQDLGAVPLLHLATRPFAWQEYLEDLEIDRPMAMSGKYFDQFLMIIAAATASLGVGLIPDYLIEQELQSGQLVPLHAGGMTTSNSYYLVTPQNQNNAHVTRLCDWLAECVSDREEQGRAKQ
ncbi:LysR family transcriptional regulator [Sulfitobacter mediterraneus]|jgi:LysR family transcriptional regulator, glycine cleavage system transcriptional activator|uniref:LysR family transcriptional regulator n=1 Tax=Sulfitobacter TaxID=60136 RepID=UPI00193337F4|nr:MULTISPECIES: LysR family transcriptional regulator [Sulfitobacter]MBM1633154.1 LysR family transcriptional regulator [Sulfitobacter mediterraneus]MBM1640712.1 LysR family transcriptional regulator [Sulfitobacter mediterraneus]MBM1645019.1 LysR family transcriptional regulator [Sulfitobacter mediterraneus]MBM1648832.1 LysR family transcriptional regulator [Sulfitobacter mediterraneus]MBM1652853.1 LysR family transcriptional regulator [Sulfitobacter mediterraneus]